MKRFLRSVVLAFFGVVLAAAAQNAEPVPSKWLHDGKLVADDFNFSVATPTPNSEWSYVRLPDIQGSKARAFIVAPSTDTKFAIIVWDKTGSMDSGSTKTFVDGMMESMPKDWRVTDAKIEPSSFPLKNSSKLSATIRLPDERTLYLYGYIVTGTRTYEFLDYSLETIEPREFRQFVSSFAFIKDPTAGNDRPAPQNYTLLALLAVIAYSASKSKRPTLTVTYAALTFAVVVAVAFGLSLLVPAYASALGTVTPILGGLFAALVALRYSSATRKAAPPTPPPSQHHDLKIEGAEDINPPGG